jgi:Xaa-Pro aminopeptidase
MAERVAAAAYPGDAALARLLAEAGSRYDVDAVRAIAAGSVGAAAGHDPTQWCRLVAADPSPELVRALQALKAQAAGDAAALVQPPVADRVVAVRAGLAELGVDGMIVPRADEYQNEYVPAANQRLAWLTGFTGSAGMAILLMDQAAIFVDGRYTLQVRAETDPDLYTAHHLIEDPPEDWVARTLTHGQHLGYDPWLLTPAQVERFAAAAAKAGATLVPLATNPLDQAWAPTRPAAPLGPVVQHPIEYAGESAADKRGRIAKLLAAERYEASVITAADSLAWLLNIRGADIEHSPLPLGYAILNQEGEVDLFIDRRKLEPGIETHLGNAVAVWDPEEFGPALDRLAGKRVQLDPATAAAWIGQRLTAAKAEIVRAANPIAVPKAVKNETELAGARAAHRRDGVAMVRFLHWLDRNAMSGALNEIAVSDRLDAFRAEADLFRDVSFPAISGAGPNGAIIHYHATAETMRLIEPGSLYLIDSGGQYLDGTTDITRTIAIDTPTDEMRDRYTRVLKGHIALATAVFPAGTTGSQLDILARLPLWQAGVTYDHGTGHGVGSYLCVHEGPARIATVPSSQPLLAGMILSNEPGYYKPGGFGVRIENLVVVVPREIVGAERPMLGFEDLTLCPIDMRPIELTLMTEAEIAWLDHYHARVRATLLPLIEEAGVRDWLLQATRRLAELHPG